MAVVVPLPGTMRSSAVPSVTTTSLSCELSITSATKEMGHGEVMPVRVTVTSFDKLPLLILVKLMTVLDVPLGKSMAKLTRRYGS